MPAIADFSYELFCIAKLVVFSGVFWCLVFGVWSCLVLFDGVWWYLVVQCCLHCQDRRHGLLLQEPVIVIVRVSL